MSDLVPKSRATSLVERLLRIPPAPEAPAGTAESTRTFRAAPGFYRYRLLYWAGKQILAVPGLAFGFYFLSLIPDFPYRFLLDYLEYLGILAYIATIPATFLLVHLDYQLRWYIVTDRSLRVREGIVHIDEKTMSFANIQNISVKQGPVQRFLGIADVEVQTAGGGGPSKPSHENSGSDMHLAYFRGVDNAQEIRDAILARVRKLTDSGLGDRDAEAIAVQPVSTSAIEAGRRLLEEVRALRQAV